MPTTRWFTGVSVEAQVAKVFAEPGKYMAKVAPLAMVGCPVAGNRPLWVYRHHSKALSAAYTAAVELTALLAVLSFGNNILPKAKVIVRMTPIIKTE